MSRRLSAGARLRHREALTRRLSVMFEGELHLEGLDVQV